MSRQYHTFRRSGGSRMIVVSLALPLLAGCCGLFAGPSADQIRASIRRSIPNGASAQQAVIVLKQKGFKTLEINPSPDAKLHAKLAGYDLQHEIIGTKVTDQCLFTLVDRGVVVKVTLDDHSRVVGVETEDTTDAP